jgi:hypothetical protein
MKLPAMQCAPPSFYLGPNILSTPVLNISVSAMVGQVSLPYKTTAELYSDLYARTQKMGRVKFLKHLFPKCNMLLISWLT